MRGQGGRSRSPSLADAIRAGDRQAMARAAAAPILPLNDNLVARPWGGRRLCAYKGVSKSPERRWGEAFEICAHDGDEEAAAHPSTIRFGDGSEIGLPALLAAAGPEILGADFAARHSHQLPLLPKTLDVGTLLSVQAHPPGLTEVYIILEAEAGATIRLGFKQDVEPAALARKLKEGRHLQQGMLRHLREEADLEVLQASLAGNFAQRGEAAEAVLPALGPLLQAGQAEGPLEASLQALKALYWEVLDLLNEIPAAPGQVIYNANPEAVGAATGRPRSAEVHALGNPQGREILALEIRLPGPTYRAWDHVRFPLRPLEVEKALGALNLQATRPADFLVTPKPLAGSPGIFRSVEDKSFVIDHFRPRPDTAVTLPAGTPWHSLHVIAGSVKLETEDGKEPAVLARGQSALIPVGMGGYRLTTSDRNSEAVMVTVPLTATVEP